VTPSKERTPAPEFTWRHYLLGSNMIAGTLQTFTLILAVCTLCTWAIVCFGGRD
jgi:hypothetical protein